MEARGAAEFSAEERLSRGPAAAAELQAVVSPNQQREVEEGLAAFNVNVRMCVSRSAPSTVESAASLYTSCHLQCHLRCAGYAQVCARARVHTRVRVRACVRACVRAFSGSSRFPSFGFCPLLTGVVHSHHHCCWLEQPTSVCCYVSRLRKLTTTM